jgi:uncharacterized transporter YbjL
VGRAQAGLVLLGYGCCWASMAWTGKPLFFNFPFSVFVFCICYLNSGFEFFSAVLTGLKYLIINITWLKCLLHSLVVKANM